MSCDWDLYCLDCKSYHGFDDTNHCVKEMRALATFGPQFQKVCTAWKEALPTLYTAAVAWFEPKIMLRESYGWHLNVEWWIAHGAHRLVPIDEYGHTDDECGEKYVCPACNETKYCTRAKGHAPPHAQKRAEGE